MSSKLAELIPKPRSKFIRVKCLDCGNEQIVFNKVASVVKCKICDGILAEPTGGQAKIRGQVIEVLE